MNKRKDLPKIWDEVGKKMHSYPYYISKTLARYKRDEFIRILNRWIEKNPACVLKTDSFEEAFGEDEILSWFKKRSDNVVSLDISFEILKQAKARFKDKEFRGVVTNISSLPFKDSSFDLIFSSSTYGYVNDLKESLREAYRVLKPGGTLIMSLNNKKAILFLLMSRVFVSLKKVPFFLSKPYVKKDVEKLLDTQKMIISKSEMIVHIFPFLNTVISWLEESTSSKIKQHLLNFIMKQLNKYSISTSLCRHFTGWFAIFKVRGF